MTSQSLPLAASAGLSPPATRLECSKLTDEEILARLQNGQGEVMTVLFDRYFRLVLSVAIRIIGDAGEAEDVMQEVFIEIFKRACLFNPNKGSARTWILQYAYHRSMNRRQYLTSRKFYRSEEIGALQLGGWDCSYSPNGWDGLTLDERTRLLQKAMENLTEEQKRCLELAYYEGLRISEIADRMAKPVEKVRGYYYRGLKKLKNILHPAKSSLEERAGQYSGVVD